MDTKNVPLLYALLIEKSVEALANTLKTALNGAVVSSISTYIQNIQTNISTLQAYLSDELKSVTNIYRPLIESYITQLKSIQEATHNLSISINNLSMLNKTTIQSNLFKAMNNMIPNIRTQVNILKKTTEGFVQNNRKKNGNGRVVTRFLNNQGNPTKTSGSIEIINNYEPFSAKIIPPKNTTGGRRSRRRTHRNSKKTRRAKKHSRHRTRRV
jgi:Fe2+ transport system protein B